MQAHISVDTLITRALLGALVAGVVAAVARRSGALSAGGQWAAFATGAVVATAGWWWAALLIAWFVTSSALTRLGRDAKRALTESILPGDAERDAMQVIANGAVFSVLALGATLTGDLRLAVAACGALAAAAADTWATETGILWGGAPRMILTGERLLPGMSGGVTVVGLGAAFAAAALMAWAATLLLPAASDPTKSIFVAVLGGGMAGSVADSILGATVQSKRWCDQCRSWTERRVHTCRYRTHHARGLRWMTNDAVNLLATITGAIVALAAVGPLD